MKTGVRGLGGSSGGILCTHIPMAELPQHLLAAVLLAACCAPWGSLVVGSAVSQQCLEVPGALVGGKGRLLCQDIPVCSASLVTEWFKVAVMERRCCKSVGQSGAAEGPE